MTDELENQNENNSTSERQQNYGIKEYYHDSKTGKFYDENEHEYLFTFQPKTSTFITSKGIEIEFYRLNQQTVANYRAAYNKKYKPEMPRRAIEYDEKKFYLEGNSSDEWYQDVLADFHEEMNIAITAYQFSLAVKNKLPPRKEWDKLLETAIASLEDLDEKPSKHRIRYEWINLMLRDNTELTAFINIVMGAEMPTMEDIRRAEERFPSTSKSE